MAVAAAPRAETGPQPPSRVARRKVPLVVQQLAFGFLLLGAWEVASGPLINPLYFSSPSEVIERLSALVASGEIFPHVRTTWLEFGLGYPVGATLGISVGLTLGLAVRLANVVQPYILALYSIPKIALAPLLVMVFGIGIESKIATVAMAVFFFVFLNSFHGARSIDHELVNIARIIGASPVRIGWRIMLPSALPAILVGLRGSVPYGIIGAIVGEYIASSEGLGWFIRQAGHQLDAASIFSGVIILMITTLTLLSVVSAIEARLVRWRPKVETQVTI